MAEVSTRQQMAQRLEAVMTRSYETLKDELRLERNHSLLKTYLVEAHSASGANHDAMLNLITTEFQQRGPRKVSREIHVAETQDEDLFTVTGNLGRGVVVLYVDTTDSRFWLTHALSKSDIADKTMTTMVSASSSLDTAWMPIEMLKSVMSMGESRGIALDFDRRYLDHIPVRKGRGEPIRDPDGRRTREQNPVVSAHHLEYAKLQLWGNGSDRILNALKEAELTNSTTLSKVRLRNVDDEDDEKFALSDVKYDGKITGRGNSFDTYNHLLLAVRDTYAATVRRTETTFRLSWEGEATPSRKGEPFHIRLGLYGISNLEHFCARIFSGSDPFRLMALPIRRNANFYTASAVDLHVNQRIDFEVSRKVLTAYLPQRACGNTLLRLYTNLQHYFSSDVEAVNGSGERVFGF